LRIQVGVTYLDWVEKLKIGHKRIIHSILALSGQRAWRQAGCPCAYSPVQLLLRSHVNALTESVLRYNGAHDHPQP
jgi:hypothetical protein